MPIFSPKKKTVLVFYRLTVNNYPSAQVWAGYFFGEKLLTPYVRVYVFQKIKCENDKWEDFRSVGHSTATARVSISTKLKFA